MHTLSCCYISQLITLTFLIFITQVRSMQMMWESKALLAQACVIETDSSLYSPIENWMARQKKTMLGRAMSLLCHYLFIVGIY